MWFPDAEGGSVKDIRSGEQVPADPATWHPPEADLHPRVERTDATVTGRHPMPHRGEESTHDPHPRGRHAARR